MVVLEKIKQFFSFLSVSWKYSMFNIHADRQLRFIEFKKKYLALKEHPDWIKWALGGQSLDDLSDEPIKLFFLAAEFPEYFKLTQRNSDNKTAIHQAINQKTFTFPTLSEISKILMRYFVSNNHKHIEIDENDVADLLIQAIELNHYQMFIYMCMKYASITQYFQSNLSDIFNEKLNNYINSNKNKHIPWFVSLFREDLEPSTIANENIYDLHTAVLFQDENSIAKLLASDRVDELVTACDENNKTAYDVAILHKYYDSAEKIFEKIKDRACAINHALYHAAWQGNAEAIHYLLKKNQTINIAQFQDKNGEKKKGLVRSCYELIVKKHEEQKSAQLLTPAMINQINPTTGDALIHQFVRENNAIAISCLCSNNADVLNLNKQGLCALDLALQLGHQEAFNILMNAVDLTKNHERVKWHCKMSWENLLEHMSSYFIAFPNKKNQLTITFFINYFAIPFNANPHEGAQNVFYFLYRLADTSEHRPDEIEQQPEFKQKTLAEKLVNIAYLYKNPAYAMKRKNDDPLMYELMITDGFYTTCGSSEACLETNDVSWVSERLKDPLFCEKYKIVLDRLETHVRTNSRAEQYVSSCTLK